MNVKIFQAFGRNEIDDLEDEINEWLEQQPAQTQIVSTNSTAAGGMGEHGGEHYQTLVVTVWYEPPKT